MLEANVAAMEADAVIKEEESRKLTVENQNLQSEVSKLRSELSKSRSVNNSLKHTILTLEAANVRKDSEIEAKIRALQEKGATISGMNEQLTRTRKYLAIEQQVSLFCYLQPLN